VEEQIAINFNVLLHLRSSYSAFLSKFALVSPRWKQARSNWHFNTLCRMVTIQPRYCFSKI